jgi:outer membrane beta-barrel protein
VLPSAIRGATTVLRAAMLGALAVVALAANPAHAKEKNNAQKALDEFRGQKAVPEAIKNKFFLKTNRFEIAPALGYVPNNAFADVYVGGAYLAYHFSENLAVEAAVLYSPETGNLGVKNLTKTLLDIAYQGDPNTSFQQPLDKMQLATAFSARYAPVYGKINLIGEGVVNFDVYGTGGIGLLLITKDIATVSDCYKNGDTGCDPVQLEAAPATQPSPAVNLGAGFDFFISQSVALKLDARTLLYVGPEPDYGNIDPQTGEAVPLKDELQSQFITTAGVSIFVPKMKSRAFNF